MRALTQHEMDQVSGGCWSWNWSFCKPKTSYSCDPKPKCDPKPACEPKPVCEPEPVCNPKPPCGGDVILPTE